jgi:hypothetical protein
VLPVMVVHSRLSMRNKSPLNNWKLFRDAVTSGRMGHPKAPPSLKEKQKRSSGKASGPRPKKGAHVPLRLVTGDSVFIREMHSLLLSEPAPLPFSAASPIIYSLWAGYFRARCDWLNGNGNHH